MIYFRNACRPFFTDSERLLPPCVTSIFVGEGMNEASRILSGGQAALEEKFRSENPDAEPSQIKLYSRNSLYLGNGLMEAAENFKDKCSSIYKFYGVPDKHGMKRDITVLQGL